VVNFLPLFDHQLCNINTNALVATFHPEKLSNPLFDLKGCELEEEASKTSQDRIAMILHFISVMLSVKTFQITKTRKKGSNCVLGNTFFLISFDLIVTSPSTTVYLI